MTGGLAFSVGSKKECAEGRGFPERWHDAVRVERMMGIFAKMTGQAGEGLVER